MGTREEDTFAGGPGPTGAVPDGAVTLLLDARGHPLSWPRPAERLLGHRAGDVLGRPATALLAPADAGRVPELVARCRADGGWRGVLSVRHRDGGSVSVEVRIVRLPREAGEAAWLILGVGRTAGRSPAPPQGLSQAMLAKIATETPVGLAVVDREMRCVWSNKGMERFGGGTLEERFGRRLAQIQPGLDAELLESVFRGVLETGEPITNYEYVGRPRSDPQRDRAHAMTVVRLDDDSGDPVGVCYSIVDVTDRYDAERQLSLLDRAGREIGRTLDVMRTAQELAEVAVPALADFVAVDLLEPVVRGWEPPPGAPGDGTPHLVRGGQQSVRPGAPETVVDIGEVATYHSRSPTIHSLTSGRSWMAARLDPTATEWARGAPGGRKARFRELGIHTSLVVPIRARGVTLGVTTFFRVGRKEAFEEADLRLAEEFVARAAVCIDNARRYTRERNAALVLQRSLLPQGVPQQDAVEVASCYRPADELSGVGGDWFDVIPLSGARVALVVGEVVGHGIDAAAAMGQLRTAVRTLADLDLPPEELLAHLDDLVVQVTREEQREEQEKREKHEERETTGECLSAGTADGEVGAGAMGATCVYAVYDPVIRTCTMAAAGHPAPALIAPGGGEADFLRLPPGPALGVGGMPFESARFVLAEGSVLALYTDGLVTAPGSGREELRRALIARRLPLDRMCREVVDQLTPERPFDDTALLVARTRTFDLGRIASWDLPVDPATVSWVREVAGAQLSFWGLDTLAFTTELVVSELVTNAIRHASGPIQLRLILGNALICEVADASSTAPHLRHPRTTDEGGRGLLLVSQFAQRWGTRYTGEGKVIWAEQFLDGSARTGQEGGGWVSGVPLGTVAV